MASQNIDKQTII